jgi:hypothetical protein
MVENATIRDTPPLFEARPAGASQNDPVRVPLGKAGTMFHSTQTTGIVDPKLAEI